jgi:hypothetical protein
LPGAAIAGAASSPDNTNAAPAAATSFTGTPNKIKRHIQPPMRINPITTSKRPSATAISGRQQRGRV